MKKFGFNASEEDIEKMVKELDKDGNGKIDLNEYLEVMLKYFFIKVKEHIRKRNKQ